MDFLEFTAGIDDNDRRIDKVLRKFIKNEPLSSIYKYLRKKLVKINNKSISQDYRVKNGDVIQIASFIIENIKQNELENTQNNKKSINLQTKDFDLDVVFQNEHLLIINKPYNVLVHGDNNSLDKQIQNFYKKSKSQNQESLSFIPGPLHRLDKKTTGLLTFSWSLQGARWFSENIKNHTIQKKYIAVVQGNLTKTEKWEDYILKKEDNNNKNFHTVTVKSKITDYKNNIKNENIKNAITEITPLKHGKYKNQDVTLVNLIIKTGRMHQIRAQASLHGFPLLGDTAYGGKKLENFEQDFFLHAEKLMFPSENPFNLPKQIDAQLPKDFLAFIDLVKFL